MTPEEIWQTVLGEMELSISKANFTTWFKGTRIIEHDSKNAIIGVPNNFTKEWLRNKYNSQIFQIIKKALPELQKIDYRIAANNTIHKTLSNKEIQATETKRATQPELAKLSSNSIFNPKYTFDNFIVGNNNRLAHATSQAVCEKPGEAYNPLFIYGGVGLGKTHLVHAIGNELHKRFPDKTSLYVSCENFTNEFKRIAEIAEIISFYFFTTILGTIVFFDLKKNLRLIGLSFLTILSPVFGVTLFLLRDYYINQNNYNNEQ